MSRQFTYKDILELEYPSELTTQQFFSVDVPNAFGTHSTLSADYSCPVHLQMGKKHVFYMFFFVYGYYAYVHPCSMFIGPNGEAVRALREQCPYRTNIYWDRRALDHNGDRCQRVLLSASNLGVIRKMQKIIADRIMEIMRAEHLSRLSTEMPVTIYLADENDHNNNNEEEGKDDVEAKNEKDKDEEMPAKREATPEQVEAAREALEVAKYDEDMHESCVALLGSTNVDVNDINEMNAVRWYNEHLREIVKRFLPTEDLGFFVTQQILHVSHTLAILKNPLLRDEVKKEIADMMFHVLADTHNVLRIAEKAREDTEFVVVKP